MIVPENLHGKKFNELTKSELWQLIYSYADMNKYPVDYEPEPKYINKPKLYFEDNYYRVWELESFFNTWTT